MQNLSTGKITDTYGDVDQINNLGNEEHIKNIIGTQNDDISFTILMKTTLYWVDMVKIKSFPLEEMII